MAKKTFKEHCAVCHAGFNIDNIRVARMSDNCMAIYAWDTDDALEVFTMKEIDEWNAGHYFPEKVMKERSKQGHKQGHPQRYTQRHIQRHIQGEKL